MGLSLADFDRIVQQEPIAAAHHPDAMRDEATRLVLARVTFKILLGAAETEQDFRDSSVALASQVRIQRAQGQDVPFPELLGQDTDCLLYTSPSPRD